MLGVFLGDGCVTPKETKRLLNGKPSNPVFRLNTIDEDFANAVASALRKISDKKPWIGKHAVKGSKNPNYSLRCPDFALCSMLLTDTQYKKCIPQYVVEWPRELQVQFVIGLMDSEGYVAEHKGSHTNRRFQMGFKSCDVWVRDLHTLMERIGIKASSVKDLEPYRSHYKKSTRINIKMQSWIDSGARFNIKRKQDKIDMFAAHGAYEQRRFRPRKPASETVREGAKCA